MSVVRPQALVLDFGELTKRADALGLFVVGLPASGGAT